MRIVGDNSDGFRNEINIEKCLDFKLFEELNPNLQHFLMDVFKGYSLKGTLPYMGFFLNQDARE